MSILDNLAQQGENQWLSEKLEDNPEEDQALQTTARIVTAHIWSFLASSISDDDYKARRGVKTDEVVSLCSSVAPHRAKVMGLVNHVLASFDADYVALTRKGAPLALEEILPALGEGGEEGGGLGGLMGGGHGGGGGGDQEEDDGSGLFSTPKVEHLLHQAPGGGVHGPYYIREDGGDYKVVNSQGEVKGTHDTKGGARAQQEAMYANIPKAREQAEKREGKAPPKAVEKVGEPGSEEQREHEKAAARRRLAEVDSNDEDDEGQDGMTPEPLQRQREREKKTKGPGAPGFFETPKTDQELEDVTSYYGTFGPGGQAKQRAEGSRRQGANVGYGDEAVPFDQLSPEERVAHLAREHSVHPSMVEGMSKLGSDALHQVLHDEAGLDVQHYHPRQSFGHQVDTFGHIVEGGRQSWRRDPENDDFDWDRYEEELEQENRTPESDVYHEHDEPEWEADWDNPDIDKYGHIRLADDDDDDDDDRPETLGYSQLEQRAQDPNWNNEQRGPEAPGNWAGGTRDRRPPNLEPGTWSIPRTGAEKKEEKEKFKCSYCGKEFSSEEALQEHEKTHREADKKERPSPGAPRAGQSKAKPSAGRQTHKPGRKPKAKKEPGLFENPKVTHLVTREAQLAPGGFRSPEEGYDPSEAFPGYYGAPEAPRRRRTAQAPLAGNSDVPQDPESDTGASGMFNPGGSLQVATPGGTVDTDFSQQDAPQDIQAQLGQLPTLSHKIGAKLAEMATEVLTYNPGMSALAAMEVAMKALRLYPKVAAGGADYLREPGTEGEPPERLVSCPQCQREAYNPEINRCHFCGFYDAGREAAIEIT